MLGKVYFRLDDFCQGVDSEKWDSVFRLFDNHGIKVCVGVVPVNRDHRLKVVHESPIIFWRKVRAIEMRGHVIALHGLHHQCRYVQATDNLLPVNDASEFTGLSFSEQLEMLREACSIFERQEIRPRVFMAPGHAFDKLTLKALVEVGTMPFITDGWSYRVFSQEGLNWIPQLFGKPRTPWLPVNTICLHPSTMTRSDFDALEAYVVKWRDNIRDFDTVFDLRYPQRDLFDIAFHSLIGVFRSTRSFLR